MKHNIIVLATVFLVLHTTGTAQTDRSVPQDSMFWFFKRKPVVTVAVASFSAAIVFLEYQWWWQEDYLYKPHPFRFGNDGWFTNYSLGVDKAGHLFTSYLYFHTAYDLMRWANYDDNTALWVAVAIPAAHAISIELADGFSKWAFSAQDLIANGVGIGYAWAQLRYPVLRNFNLKWSYFPTEAVKRPDKDWGFSHDYSGHIYWISFNVHNLLPGDIRSYWPRFLNIAVGYGGKNVSYGDTGAPRHKYAVAIDYNMTEIPLVGDTWEMLKRLADKVHFPAPGIKVYSDKDVQAKILLLN